MPGNEKRLLTRGEEKGRRVKIRLLTWRDLNFSCMVNAAFSKSGSDKLIASLPDDFDDLRPFGPGGLDWGKINVIFGTYSSEQI